VAPRAIVSWLSALGDNYNGQIPGSGELFKFDRSSGLYSGEVHFADNVIQYNQIPGLELVAILSVGLGEELESVSAKPRDLQKLGKSLDKMVNAVLKFEKSSAIRGYLSKADLSNSMQLEIPGTKRPRPVMKVEPKGTMAKPGAAQAPAAQTGAAAPMAPKKQVSVQNPTVSSIPGMPSKSFKVAKHEAARACEVCGQGRFLGERFVGCPCYVELAKSITTKPLPDGYMLKTSGDFESFASLASSILRDR
jgi:hypothetical protein